VAPPGSLESSSTSEGKEHGGNESYTFSTSTKLSHLPSETHSLHVQDDTSSLIGAVNRLQRLALAIRSPNVISHASKAIHYKPSKDGDAFETQQQEFEAYSLRIVQHKFERTSEVLQLRLSKANAARRRLFLYRRYRHEVLSTRRHESSERPPLAPPVVPDAASGQPDTTIAFGVATEDLHSARQTDDDSHHRPIEKATTFAESRFQPDAPSVAPSSLGGSSVSSFFRSLDYHFLLRYPIIENTSNVLTVASWFPPSSRKSGIGG
jgi:hypothetical protein